MRESNRNRILDGAIEIVQREGVKALTFDAVAAETGLTRGGLIYHFRSRDELVKAMHSRLAEAWEDEMVASAGKAAAEASVQERTVAYVKTCLRSPRRVELLMMLECATDPELNAIWLDVGNRWSPPVDVSDDPSSGALMAARFAADGLWLMEAHSPGALNPATKQQVVDWLIRLVLADEDNADISKTGSNK